MGVNEPYLTTKYINVYNTHSTIWTVPFPCLYKNKLTYNRFKYWKFIELYTRRQEVNMRTGPGAFSVLIYTFCEAFMKQFRKVERGRER